MWMKYVSIASYLVKSILKSNTLQKIRYTFVLRAWEVYNMHILEIAGVNTINNKTKIVEYSCIQYILNLT